MERNGYIAAIAQAFAVHPIVAILGPRQCGKTTLARMYADAKGVDVGTVTHLDLEDPTDQTRLEDPKLFLERPAKDSDPCCIRSREALPNRR